MSGKHIYTLRRDSEDRRDFKYSSIQRDNRSIPPEFSLRSHFPPVDNQENENSCSANAYAAALETLMLCNNKPFVKLSRNFIYYIERDWAGTVNEDGGASLRDGVKALSKYGVCPEQLWPYTKDTLFTPPPKNCYDEALKYKVTQYLRINSLDDMRHSIATGYPVVIGIAIYESFESDYVAHTGIVPMPDATKENLNGYHATIISGYNDTKQLGEVRNSWGDTWGDAGYFYLPYEFLDNHDLCIDAWCVKAGFNM